MQKVPVTTLPDLKPFTTASSSAWRQGIRTPTQHFLRSIKSKIAKAFIVSNGFSTLYEVPLRFENLVSGHGRFTSRLS